MQKVHEEIIEIRRVPITWGEGGHTNLRGYMDLVSVVEENNSDFSSHRTWIEAKQEL